MRPTLRILSSMCPRSCYPIYIVTHNSLDIQQNLNLHILFESFVQQLLYERKYDSSIPTAALDCIANRDINNCSGVRLSFRGVKMIYRQKEGTSRKNLHLSGKKYCLRTVVIYICQLYRYKLVLNKLTLLLISK